VSVIDAPQRVRDLVVVRQNCLEYHLQPEGFIVLQVQDLAISYLIDFLIESA
jgi:hypothetical protein